MNKTGNRILLGCLLLIAVSLIGCADKIVNEDVDKVPIQIAFNTDTGTAIEYYTVNVSGPGMTDITSSLEYNIVSGTVEGEISVPAGSNRLFVIEAQDDSREVIYRGETIADVIRGVPLELSISMVPVVPCISVIPHRSTKLMGEDISIEVFVWNLPQLYDIAFNLYYWTSDTPYIWFDSAQLGVDVVGNPQVSITEGANWLGVSVARISAIETILDSTGSGQLLRLYFHSTIDTPFDTMFSVLNFELLSLSFTESSDITVNTVHLDGAVIEIIKDTMTGDTTTAQGWAKTFGIAGDDFGRSVAVLDEGNIISVGQHFASGNEWNMYFVATDSNGNYLNDNTYGVSGSDIAVDVIAVSNQAVSTGWTATATEGEDIFIAGLDNLGNFIWQNSIGGDGNQRASRVISATGGGYLLAGKSGSSISDILVVKTNALGDSLWAQTYDLNTSDEAFALTEALNGDIIVTGITGSHTTFEYDIFIMRLDPSGNLLWDTTYGGSQLDWATAIVTNDDGSFTLCGYTYSFGSGAGDMYVLKVNSSCEEIWSQTVGGTGHERGNDIARTADGQYIIAGLSSSFSSAGSNAVITMIGAGGGVVWQKNYSSGINVEAFGVDVAPEGQIIVTGSTESLVSGNFDTFILKMNSEGIWQ